MYQIDRLTQHRREAKACGEEGLVAIVAGAEELAVELQAETKHIDESVEGGWDR